MNNLFKILFYNICFPLNQLNLLKLTTYNIKTGYYHIYINKYIISKNIYLYDNIQHIIYFNNTNIKTFKDKQLLIYKSNFFTKPLIYSKNLVDC